MTEAFAFLKVCQYGIKAVMKPSVVCFCCGAKRDKTQNEKRDTLWLWCSAFSEAAHVFFFCGASVCGKQRASIL